MPHPNIVRNKKTELIALRLSGMALTEIAKIYGVNESSIRKVLGKTGIVREWRTRPISERFWKKVDKKGPDDCWEWKGSKSSSGYGHIIFEGKTTDAHRVSYILTHGEIPENLLVLHNCNNKTCVNPRHLRSGTQSENMHDLAKARKTGAASVTIRKA